MDSEILLAFLSATGVPWTRGVSGRSASRSIHTPDGLVFLSLFKQPRSVITAAELLAEIGDGRARYLTRDALAVDAGHAAVAKSPANARP